MHKKSPFEKKVRVRVCGILKEEGKILLVKHRGIGESGHLWAPPGGGVEFGERLTDALQREFLEETNVQVKVEAYLFTNEHIDDRHHAIEVFFEVTRLAGNLELGHDPELPPDDQMIKDVRFFSAKELEKLPKSTLHEAFFISKSRDGIDDLRGLITFKD